MRQVNELLRRGRATVVTGWRLADKGWTLYLWGVNQKTNFIVGTHWLEVAVWYELERKVSRITDIGLEDVEALGSIEGNTLGVGPVVEIRIECGEWLNFAGVQREAK